MERDPGDDPLQCGPLSRTQSGPLLANSAATALDEPTGTVAPMTPSAPPIRARAGSGRARQLHVPALPIRATLPPAAGPKQLPPSPLRALRRPEEISAPLAMSLRVLDRGRVHAPDLVSLLQWEPGTALEVDVRRPHRLRLRPHRGDGGAVIGSHRSHLDGAGRIVVTSGARRHLVVAANDSVLVWAERDGDDKATGVIVVANPAIVERALVALVAFEDANMTAETSRLAVVREVV